jgi:hypothetical protein
MHLARQGYEKCLSEEVLNDPSGSIPASTISLNLQTTAPHQGSRVPPVRCASCLLTVGQAILPPHNALSPYSLLDRTCPVSQCTCITQMRLDVALYFDEQCA